LQKSQFQELFVAMATVESIETLRLRQFADSVRA